MRETIAAVSSAMSEAGIGIIRISGPEAMQVIKAIFRPGSKDKDILSVPSHTIHYGYIYDEETMVDEVLVMIMRSPRTYTGEDTVEIDCHGGILSMKKVLETVLKNGASIAQPGEFTKRAFLNGRLDLTQAEAVMDVIQSRNEYALQSSLEQLKGSLSEKIAGIRKDLLYQIAYIESALDDPEHISLDGYTDTLCNVTKEQIRRLTSMLDHFSDGKLIREGIRTVILGKPNAGKSSLLNTMLGEERAIVTNIAGTTRDTLEEFMNIKGITLHLIDTAGIRNTEDTIEKIGVERSRDMADKADLILYVVDSSTPLDENDEEIIGILKDRKVIVLYNKTDLVPEISLEEVISMVCPHPVIPVSMIENKGLEELEDTIEEMFFSGNLSFNDEVYITNSRHKEALQEALEALNLVMQGAEYGMPEDCLAIDLRNACEALGRITGESVSEDIVNEIFSKFCIGK